MYNHKDIELKWRKAWEVSEPYRTAEGADDGREKCYALVMFPYPSGAGLHAGHARVYIGADIYARMKRMQGCRVLHPMGWDAFGLPAEEYAIKNKKHPRETTAENIANFKEQCKQLALSYDWNREISTTDPAYYKWTQWIFLQLFNRGLAYQSHLPVNWCPQCKTGLANEDLQDMLCERCSCQVERKPLRQWVLRITEYADRLVDDLETLTGWEEHVREIQRNWIGRRTGYDIPFAIPALKKDLTIFTTRPDTLFGCSFIALSPESPYLDELLPHLKNVDAVQAYRQQAYTTRPQEAERAKTGVVCEGVFAVHPITKKEIPLYVADYVLAGYGTGAIFGAPGHDERDFAFAEKYNLPVVRVVEGENPLPDMETAPDAVLVNSGSYDGLRSEEAKETLAKAAGGKQRVAYKLQDWVFSRQRYWGEPIPLVHCEACGVVPVPEKDLPVTLPEVESYEPTGDGESPLAGIEEWVRTSCPQCGGPARRETNTMPQWAGSSWYHLRYIDPHNDTAIVDPQKAREWMPVDIYTGGMEHAARHLIYARFWHKFLYDIGVVHTLEPYSKLKTVGILQAEGGGKMSKRLGNVVNPVELANDVGTDVLRTYIAHIAPFSQTVAWDGQAIVGMRRFLERVYMLREKVSDVPMDEGLVRLMHQTIISVRDDIASYKFNTALSSLMIFSNALRDSAGAGDGVAREAYETLLCLLAPFAPYLTEELWEMLGHQSSIHNEPFPQGDTSLAKDATVTIAVQVSGKMRGTVTLSADSSQEEVLAAVQGDAQLAERVAGKQVKAYVANKIISFV